MNLQNVEIKAFCSDPNNARAILKQESANFKGVDHQVDTYFQANEGRLKLREGTIENNLIFYRRPDTSAPKHSDIQLVQINQTNGLKPLLSEALGITVIVEKRREIYFIDNVKFHIDEVKKLGSFIEIEAIDCDGSIGETRLHQQCREYMEMLAISEKDLIAKSYSDLLKEQQAGTKV